MRRVILIGLLASLLPLLQGCLLDLFFAPKISAGELPQDPAMEALRSAYIANCGRCHLLIAPRYFTRERPIDFFTERYRNARILTRQEADEVSAYIRILATNPSPPEKTPENAPTPLPTAPGIDLMATPTPSPTSEPSPAASPTASP